MNRKLVETPKRRKFEANPDEKRRCCSLLRTERVCRMPKKVLLARTTQETSSSGSSREKSGQRPMKDQGGGTKYRRKRSWREVPRKESLDFVLPGGGIWKKQEERKEENSKKGGASRGRFPPPLRTDPTSETWTFYAARIGEGWNRARGKRTTTIWSKTGPT